MSPDLLVVRGGFNRPPYYYQKLLRRARWKTRDRGPGVRGPGVWKTRIIENTAGSGGKHGSK